jgi:hypothetical protein
MALAAIVMLVIRAHAQDPCFYWDMEQERPNIFTGDSTPAYYSGVSLSTEAAHGGTRSLKTSAGWAAATFDNPTNTDVWCPVTQGTVEFWWRYVAPWGSRMLFQITGKTRDSLSMDTNDGFGITTRPVNPGQFVLGFGYHGADSVVEVRNRYSPVELVDGKWYRFRIRYRVNGDPSLSMQIDDHPPVTSSNHIGATACRAWHQILIGNDLDANAVQYIDDFKIWPVWIDDMTATEASSGSPRLSGTAACCSARRTLSARNRAGAPAEFDVAGRQLRLSRAWHQSGAAGVLFTMIQPNTVNDQ